MAAIEIQERRQVQEPQASRQKMTLAEFERLPEGPPFYEFENGETILMTSPKNRHQLLMARLFGAMDAYVVQHQAGMVTIEVDVYLPDGRVLIPALTYLTAANVGLLDSVDDKIHGVPDLVVEIVSENVYRDEVHKLRVYKANGIPWYWTIHAETLVLKQHLFLPDGTTQLDIVDKFGMFAPTLFPGLTLELVALMGEPNPAAELRANAETGAA